MNWTSGGPVLKFQKIRTGWPHPGALLETLKLLNKKKGYLGNFIKGSCRIKILYGDAGREYGGEEEFVQNAWVKDMAQHAQGKQGRLPKLEGNGMEQKGICF